MLVLSRQRDETIMIGDDIEITIVDIRGDKVRLGITAPATIPVHRKEVYDAIQRENREAARVKMEDLASCPRLPASRRRARSSGAAASSRSRWHARAPAGAPGSAAAQRHGGSVRSPNSAAPGSAGPAGFQR